MKKLYILGLLLFISITTFAQEQDFMSYQAVIRNSDNNLIVNQPIGIKISILQGSLLGTVAYTETQNPTSNSNGLITLEIGNGNSVTGNYSTIDWANGPYFIKTEIDPTGGTSYTIIGTSQLMSVPYALYAKTSGSSIPGPQGVAGLNGIDGVNGLDGATGPMGPQGVAGLNGIDGINGLDGATGPMGPQGPVGLNGIDGINGLDGATGPMGPQGVAGLNGIDGQNGLDGATGPMGPQGPVGLNGIDGQNGLDGATGPMGPQGPAGLNGIDGVNGLDGATGPMGPQGPAGLNGIDGNDGLDGATGPMGPQGMPGMDGMRGMDGMMGMPGNDGLDGATGPMGPQGPAGNDGLDGATGPMGPQGPAGLNGIDGINGLDGATGPMGPQGLQGPAGEPASLSATKDAEFENGVTDLDSGKIIYSSNGINFSTMLSEGFTCTIINIKNSGTLQLSGFFYSKMFPSGAYNLSIEAGATVRVNVITVDGVLRYYLSGDIYSPA